MNYVKLKMREYLLLAGQADREGNVKDFWWYAGAAYALQELERHNEKKGERMARSQMDDHPSGK